MLRKLGTSLIGQDGLLTTAASGEAQLFRWTASTRLAAQSEVQGQEKFKQEQDLAARRAEAHRLALETNTYNLGRAKTTNAQADAERSGQKGHHNRRCSRPWCTRRNRLHHQALMLQSAWPRAAPPSDLDKVRTMTALQTV